MSFIYPTRLAEQRGGMVKGKVGVLLVNVTMRFKPSVYTYRDNEES